MSDYDEDEDDDDVVMFENVDWAHNLWEMLEPPDDTEFCFRCGFPLEHGECANAYCLENPNYCTDDGDGPQ